MDNAPQIKGWCPGALRPMMSGDGLVVRVRPPMGRLDVLQAVCIAQLSIRCGNGIIDLSNRANVQLRGVTQDSYEVLIDGLREVGLIDENATAESRRNIIVTPFREDGDENTQLTTQLATALARPDAPDVSAKFGYTIDAGRAPVLQNAPADIRLERGADGQLIICAADHHMGKPVKLKNAIAQMFDLARWSLGKGTRMAHLLSAGMPLPHGFTQPRQVVPHVPQLGRYPAGTLVAIEFGQIDAATLAALAALGPLRITPWRMLLVEGAVQVPDMSGLITDIADPLLRVVACVGAPQCAQGHAPTRELARDLAAHLPADLALHVSGCAKGCAQQRPADITFTATSNGFDFIRNATADAPPSYRGLSRADIFQHLQKAP